VKKKKKRRKCRISNKLDFLQIAKIDTQLEKLVLRDRKNKFPQNEKKKRKKRVAAKLCSVAERYH